MYDIAVIGSGPAGISASINLKILGKNFIWFSGRDISKKVSQAQLVKNYLGLSEISGAGLEKSFLEHCESMGIKPE